MGINEKVNEIAFLLLRYQKEEKLGIEAALKIKEDLPKECQSDFGVAHERAMIINSFKAEADKLKFLFANSGMKTAATLVPEASMILAHGKKYMSIKKKHTTHFVLSAFVVSYVLESKKATTKEAMKICWHSFDFTYPYRCDIIEDVLRNLYIDAKAKREEIKPILPNSSQCKSITEFMKKIRQIEIEVIGRITDASDKGLMVVIKDMIDACIRESAFDYCISAMTCGTGSEEIIESMKQYIETFDKDKRIGCLTELVNSIMNSDKITPKDLNIWEKTLKKIAIKLISEQLCNQLFILRKEEPSGYTQEAAIFKALREILPSIWTECKLLFMEIYLKQMKLCALVDDANDLYKKWMSRNMKERERNILFQCIVCDAYKEIYIKKEEMRWIVETCLKDEPPNLIYNFYAFNEIIASNKSSESIALVSILEKLEVEYIFRDISDWIATLNLEKNEKKSKEYLNSLIVSIYHNRSDLEIERDEPKIKTLFKDLSINWKIYVEYLFLALKLRFLLKHPCGQIEEKNAKVDKLLNGFENTSKSKKPLNRAMIFETLRLIAGSDYEKLRRELAPRWNKVFGGIEGQDDYEMKEVDVIIQGDVVMFKAIAPAAVNNQKNLGKESLGNTEQSDKKVIARIIHKPKEETAKDLDNQGLNYIEKIEAKKEELKYSLNPEKAAHMPSEGLISEAKPKVVDASGLLNKLAYEKGAAAKKIESYDSFIEAIKAGRQFVAFENNVLDLEGLKASNVKHHKMLIPYIGRDIGKLVYSGKIKDIPTEVKCGETVDTLAIALFPDASEAKQLEKYQWKKTSYDCISEFFIKVSLKCHSIKKMMAQHSNIKDFGKYVTLRRSTDKKQMNYVLLFCMQGDIDEYYSKLAQDVLDDTEGKGPVLRKDAANNDKVTFIADIKDEFSKWLIFYINPDVDSLNMKGPFVRALSNNVVDRVLDYGLIPMKTGLL